MSNLEKAMSEARENFARQPWEAPKEPRKPEELGAIRIENWIEIKKDMIYDDLEEKPEWQRTINCTPDASTIGTFYENNRVLTFVDGQCRQFISPSTPELIAELKGAGYIEGAMSVPFSNGQIPTDPALKEKLNELLNKRSENEEMKK
ncbi:MAG: hypothetical protein ACD_8C00101G0001 [uncultured bacterium]|nr:MAG: hypothetical protein ACD_8C00101G0001 [uncultured bacterium]